MDYQSDVVVKGAEKSQKAERGRVVGGSDGIGVGHNAGNGTAHGVGSGIEMGVQNGQRKQHSSGGQGKSQVRHQEQQPQQPVRQQDEHGHHGHGHSHEFGRKGREMVRRLKRSLVGGGGDTASNKQAGAQERQQKERATQNGESGDEYSADLESLAVEEKEKEKRRKGARTFSFF
jgi:hypothetical protein